MALTAQEDQNRRLLRARDAIDRDFAKPLDVSMLARIAVMSPAHFSRTFNEIMGLSPTAFRDRTRPLNVPVCFAKSWSRPSSFG